MTQRKQLISEIPSSETPQNEMNKYDVVIVGAGLGGLTAAVEATLAGKSVLVIESRQEGLSTIRPQLIFLRSSTYLKSLNDRSKNKKTMQDHTMFLTGNKLEHFAIKDIQRFLMRKIDNRLCTFVYESKVTEINLDKGRLLVANVVNPSQQMKVEFEYLILADGAKHHTANLLTQYIQYQPCVGRPEKKNVMAYFKVKARAEQRTNPLIPEPLVMLAHDNRCGYVYYENDMDKTRFKVCVVMHVSDQQFEKYKVDQKSGIAFLTHCVASVFDSQNWKISMTASAKSGLEKDKLKYTAFELEFMEANTSAFEYKGRKVVLIGDARRSADFYIGHGGFDAIADGELVGRLINKEISISKYNKKRQTRSDLISRETSGYQPIIDRFNKLESRLDRYVVPHFNDAVPKCEVGSSLSAEQFRLFPSFERSNANKIKENKITVNRKK